jgi:hypothetical protein
MAATALKRLVIRITIEILWLRFFPSDLIRRSCFQVEVNNKLIQGTGQIHRKKRVGPWNANYAVTLAVSS